MDLVFDLIQIYLDKKKADIKTEEDQKVCDFIQQLQQNKAAWLALTDIQVTGLLYFLGIKENEKRYAIYWDIHSPENEEKYGKTKVIFKK